MSDDASTTQRGPAVVFGARVEQGRAVLSGLVDQNYGPVFGVTRTLDHAAEDYSPEETNRETGVTWIAADIASSQDVERVLRETQARSIFVVTTTDMPTDVGFGTGFHVCMEDEYQCLIGFFQVLKQVHKDDGVKRHVILSTLDDVQGLCRDILSSSGEPFIVPLDDGSIVPHYSGKGRAGEDAQTLLRDIDGLILTRITLPFLHSNFLGFFVPLPNRGQTQWTISASFGQDSKIDMISTSDLAYIVPRIFESPDTYRNQNLRLSAERLSMDQVAAEFADLFGKDVIYNPLTAEEVSAMPFPSAPCMAQMCQFLSDPTYAPKQDIELTKQIMYTRTPQLFGDWLLVHSDHSALEQVGLSVDAPDITKVTVFGGNSLEGTSVIRGLLADTRKSYTIRATTRHPESGASKQLQSLDPKRVEVVYADLDRIGSCIRALDGMHGAFLVTDYLEDMLDRTPEMEERHAKNVIDACEEVKSVRHLVFSSMENVEDLNEQLQHGLQATNTTASSSLDQFDSRSRAAAYARTKELSVTFVLMPIYAEVFLEWLKPERRIEDGGKERMVMAVPMKNDTQVMCMSIEDLGPAVANIFDSYQVYAGHEIGLVTDFVTVKEVADILTDVMDGGSHQVLEQEQVETKEWVEARGTYMKDLGEIFQYMAHTEAVQKRRSVAKTMELVPTARPLRQWVEQNKDNPSFREKLGLR